MTPSSENTKALTPGSCATRDAAELCLVPNDRTRSLRAGRGHSSDQTAVWGQVQTQHDTLGVTSQTHSMTDTVVHCADRVGLARRTLPYVEGSSGLVVAVGPRIVAVDLFDSPTTCRRVWDRLVAGVCLDGLMARREAGEPSSDQITSLFADARSAEWVSAGGVGERPFDLIFLDVWLPGLTGYDLARWVRGHEGRRPPHLVAVTEHGGDAARQATADVGIDQFVLKPLDPTRLDELLARAVREQDRRAIAFGDLPSVLPRA